MELQLSALVEFLARWVHFLAGVVWIGILYYFNFVQTEFFKETTPDAKSAAIQKLVPRALAWFRYGALLTFLSGVYIMGAGKLTSTYMMTGALLGTLMFLNVWLIIWPNQKIVIESTNRVLNGESALDNAASALAKAGLASRTNTLFSIPMLFFMGASAHLAGTGALPIGNEMGTGAIGLLATFGLILLLEANAIKGKQGPMTSVVGVIHCGIALAAILFALIQYL